MRAGELRFLTILVPENVADVVQELLITLLVIGTLKVKDEEQQEKWVYSENALNAEMKAKLIAPVAWPASDASALVWESLQPDHEIYTIPINNKQEMMR